MAVHMLVQSSLASSSARGIRVVLCEPEAQVRAHLRSFIDPDPVLTLVAETCNWSECEVVLQDLSPELLIARADLIPLEWDRNQDQESYSPVVIALGPSSVPEHGPPRQNAVPAHSPPEVIRKSLNQAVRDIYDRKAKQLLYLVDRYIAGSTIPPKYDSTIIVEQDGEAVELRTEDIVAVIAARKYVSILTRKGQHLLREPIHALSERLDPRIFIRIHRSIMVNCSYVDTTVPITPRSSYVVLSDGSKYPVSSNYRNSFYQAIKSGSHRFSTQYRPAS